MRNEKQESIFQVMDRSIEMGKAYYRQAGVRFSEAIDRPGLFRSVQELYDADPESLPSYAYDECLEYRGLSLIHSSSYADYGLQAVNFGRDTDTNAVVASNLAGLSMDGKLFQKDGLRSSRTGTSLRRFPPAWIWRNHKRQILMRLLVNTLFLL